MGTNVIAKLLLHSPGRRVSDSIRGVGRAQNKIILLLHPIVILYCSENNWRIHRFPAGLSGQHISHVFARQRPNHHFSVLNQNNGTGCLLKTRGYVLISLGLFLAKFLLVTVAKIKKSLDFFLD